MKIEELIANLNYVKHKYEGKPVFTGQINIVSMCDDIIRTLKELQPKEDFNCSECSRRKFYQEGFRDGTIWGNNNWYMINDGIMPKDLGYDWVKIQIKERYTDFLWVPRVAEFRSDKWWLIGNDNDDCMLDEDVLGVDVIAWQVIRPFPESDTYKTKTRLDRIRNMSDIELADWLWNFFDQLCFTSEDEIVTWLNTEVKYGTGR